MYWATKSLVIPFLAVITLLLFASSPAKQVLAADPICDATVYDDIGVFK
jgi:hypothetical protein